MELNAYKLIVMRIYVYKDYTRTKVIQGLVYGCGCVKRVTNSFHIKRYLDELHKERVPGVAGKYVTKKHRDSVLYSVMVLFDNYQF
jgi:hypothetical protein